MYRFGTLIVAGAIFFILYSQAYANHFKNHEEHVIGETSILYSIFCDSKQQIENIVESLQNEGVDAGRNMFLSYKRLGFCEEGMHTVKIVSVFSKVYKEVPFPNVSNDGARMVVVRIIEVEQATKGKRTGKALPPFSCTDWPVRKPGIPL